MKKSKVVSLSLMNGIIVGAMTACGPDRPAVVAVDPCNRATFNPPACEMAINQHGYNYNGGWYPLFYPSPYSYYYGSYDSYRRGGGHIYAAPMASYSNHYVSPTTRANVFVSRQTAGGKVAVSPSRMNSVFRAGGGSSVHSAFGSAGRTSSSFSAGRSGATMGRGGFGGIGGGRSSFGGGSSGT